MDTNENYILRKVDAVGRITIPPKLLNHLRINIGDSIIIYIHENKDIVVKKDDCSCVFCGSDNLIKNTDTVKICPNCKRDFEKVYCLITNRYDKQIIPKGRRLVIPFKIRNQLTINTGDEIIIIPTEDCLLLRIKQKI